MFRKSRRTRKISFIQKKLRHWFREIYVKDLQLHLEMEAMRETLEYIKSNMSDSMIFTDWHDLHAFAMEQAEVDGMYLELGVKRGGSIRERIGCDRECDGWVPTSGAGSRLADGTLPC